MPEKEITLFIEQFNTLYYDFITLVEVSKKSPFALNLLFQLFLPMSRRLGQISSQINVLINTARNTSGESPEISQAISTHLNDANEIVENTKFTLSQFLVFVSKPPVIFAFSSQSFHKPGI